jgi:hypothetical protein
MAWWAAKRRCPPYVAHVAIKLGKGLPIGNLTSQHFANLYLGKLDHEIKDKQAIKGYVRYMDDMLLFAKDKKTLHQYLQHLESFIHEQLALKLKPSATLIAPVSEGIPFLGFRIYPNLIRLNRQSLRRFRRRKISYERAYKCGKLDVEKTNGISAKHDGTYTTCQ